MGMLVVVAVLLWIALPFAPALLELRRRQDAGSLPLSDRYQEDLRLADSEGYRHTSPQDVYEENGEMTAAPGCPLVGTVSAERTLRLNAGCSFERLHAPTVWFGNEVERADCPAEPCTPFEPPPGVEKAANRFLVRGDLVVPEHTLIESDLVVTGALHLGAGTVMEGSAKSHGHLVLAPNVVVRGSLFSKGDLRVGARSHVCGIAVAEEELVLAAGSVVGMGEAETTASGRWVKAEAGACVHGTVWALEGGCVTGPGGREAGVEGGSVLVGAEALTDASFVPSGNTEG